MMITPMRVYVTTAAVLLVNLWQTEAFAKMPLMFVALFIGQ